MHSTVLRYDEDDRLSLMYTPYSKYITIWSPLSNLSAVDILGTESINNLGRQRG